MLQGVLGVDHGDDPILKTPQREKEMGFEALGFEDRASGVYCSFSLSSFMLFPDIS